jgi:hypothetical protein
MLLFKTGLEIPDFIKNMINDKRLKETILDDTSTFVPLESSCLFIFILFLF